MAGATSAVATGKGSDKPRLSPLERSERRYREREVASRIAEGEAVAALALEYGVIERTVERWARRGRG
jgi:DNA-binding NarL/FixJ family response regulator